MGFRFENKMLYGYCHSGVKDSEQVASGHESNFNSAVGYTVSFADHSCGQPEVMQQTTYYPFGYTLEQSNYYSLWSEMNKNLYNGKELQDDELGGVRLDWYDYGARFYDPQIGRFTGVDPIAEKFYWVTPYNYAENRPISGIDLWGLQYLEHNKARIIAQYGQIRIKTSNLHNITANKINAMNENPKYWKSGEIGVNTTIGQLNMKNFSSTTKAESASMDNTYGATDPNYNPTNTKTQRGEKKDGTPDMRQKERTVAGGSGMGKAAAGGMLILNAVNFGLEITGGLMVFHDMNLIKGQISADILGKALGDLNTAISQGMIPEDYMNTGSLTDILNVILQGENTTDNKAIMQIGTKILQDISKNYDEEKIMKY